MIRGRIASLALLVLMSLASPSAGAPPEVVNCPAEAPVVRRLHLKERWRVDADDPDAPLLGYFDQSLVLVHAGRVYMLDRQLCHILVYSDDGEYLATLMQEGDGPGEVRNPGAMFLCSDGRIAVRHGFPTRLEFIDLGGTPQGSWHIQATAGMNRIQETPLGWFGVYTESKNSDEPGAIVSVFRAALLGDDGARVAEFHSQEVRRRPGQGEVRDEAEDYKPWRTAVAVGEGEVVFASARDEYRLEWRNLGGEILRVVSRPFAAHRRSRDELKELEFQSYIIVNGSLEIPEQKLCENDPMIRALDPLPDGSLRVRTSLFEKDMPPGMVCRYEVHEPTGELRESVEIYDPSGDYDVDYDAIALLSDGQAMVLRNLRPAFRVATDGWLHPKLREKLPPPRSGRDDIAFTPIMCDLVLGSRPGEQTSADEE